MRTNRVFVPGVHASPRRSEMDKKHDGPVRIISRKEGVKRRYQRNGLMDLSELWAIYSLHIEGTNTLVMGGLG